MGPKTRAQIPPDRRPLKIFAFDPMLGRESRARITVDVPYEPLDPGPVGSRIKVVDFDGANGRYYAPVNLNDPHIAMQSGLDPSTSDPRFHQQMVYAVATRVLENFDVALGRRIQFRRNNRLRIVPHAFQVANAFYNRDMLALLFGYFQTEKGNPGAGLPGQTVFTCLSHDIIAHEMAHALVDRLRPLFLEPSNHDVAAFHEGFADIIAIFQHFSFPGILRDTIQENRSDLRLPGPFVALASEFGRATGSGEALRTAVDEKQDPRLYERVFEAHERGSILVAAVFDAFFQTYQRRIRDLIRIATGGTGTLPEGDLHPDLVNRIAGEATKTAQSILTMCIRAFEYLPPVDVTFGDFLRALVTADYELSPADEAGQRAAMIEAFRLRGIYPEHVSSLAEESLLWEMPEDLEPIPLGDLADFPQPAAGQAARRGDIRGELFSQAQQFSRTTSWRPWSAEPESIEGLGVELEPDVTPEMGSLLHTWASAEKCRTALGLDPKLPIFVQGFHSVFRVNRLGQLLVELVAQFTQKDDSRTAEWGGLPLRGGATVVASAEGRVRYLIPKPLPSTALDERRQRQALLRVGRQERFVEECDALDPRLAFSGSGYRDRRMAAGLNFARLHGGSLR